MWDLIYIGDLSVVEFRAIAAQVLGDANTPSRARVNAAVNGTEPFGARDKETVENLNSVMADLVQLKHEHKVPINFSKVEKIAEIIRARRDENRNSAPTYVYVVRLSAFAYFRCVRAGEIVTTPSLGDCVMTESREVAQGIVDALRKNFKTKAAYESFTNTICRRQDTMANDLASVGINE
jgi:hypothetical protein